MGFIISNRNAVWPMGEIPYVIRSGAITANANQAINHWNQEVGNHICLIPRTVETDYVSLDSSTTGHSISSGAGRTGGQQNIVINPTRAMGLTNVSDTNGLITGLILHELGHAAGLLHEHQRHDRDDHVTIHWQNIPPDRCGDFWSTASYDRNHCERIRRRKKRLYRRARNVGAYDFDSITHYLSTHAHRSTANRSPQNGIPPDRTITRNGIPPSRYNDRNFEPFRGHLRATLSDGDKDALRTLYPHINWQAITAGRRNRSQDVTYRPQRLITSDPHDGVQGNVARQYPLGLAD